MANRTALIVDDEPDIRELLSITLVKLDLDVTEAANLAEAIQHLKKGDFSFCLTDMRLPDGDGLNLIDHVQDNYPDIPIAVITAHGSTDLAVEALKRGAFDFVTKPVQLPRLRSMVKAALSLRGAHERAPDRQRLLGSSSAMATLRQQISRVARSQAPIFISGESGSGKEVVARAIHYESARASGSFIPVNCGAIPSELMESEFFGHRKGSFTGAHQDKQGLFQAADGGTLFLDEVADLPLPMQVKLLRGIQEKAIRPVGAEQEIPVDIRILSATHKNLSAEVTAGSFRQDLYYRINVIEIPVPALRERREDIPELARFFLQRFAQDTGDPEPELTAEALAALKSYPFPGNVRELENTLERAFTLCDQQRITASDLHLNGEKASAIDQESLTTHIG
ncbi:MAG: sigma-54-dependent transcriptional regulator, partial [Porticoccaceae bacterium]